MRSISLHPKKNFLGIHESLMLDFTKLNFRDAAISAVHGSGSSVEVVYLDWQDQKHTLVFVNAISCCMFSPYGRALSHGEVETNADYVRECCNVADENFSEQFFAFSFVDAWTESKILRIVAEAVIEEL